MTRSRMIVVGGSAALVVLLALSWLLVLAPRLGQSGEIKAQTESVQTQTARLEAEIAQLEAIKSDLPAAIARFTELRGNFPTTADVPATLDQIRAAAGAAGVKLDSLENGVPTILAAETAASGAEGTAAEAPAAAPAGDGSARAGAVGLPAADGNLASMSVSVTVNGSYAQVSAFLRKLQDIPRAWLIDTVTTQGGQESGTVSLTASGAMYVLDTTAVQVPSSPVGAVEVPSTPVGTVPTPSTPVGTVPAPITPAGI